MNRSMEALAAQVTTAVSAIREDISNQIGTICVDIRSTEEKMKQMITGAHVDASLMREPEPTTTETPMQITPSVN